MILAQTRLPEATQLPEPRAFTSLPLSAGCPARISSGSGSKPRSGARAEVKDLTGGDHFRATVVSDAFNGLSRLERHRMGVCHLRGPGRRRDPRALAPLTAAANSSGGVLGKMISPQTLAIFAASVGMAGQEGRIFRKVIGWSLLLLVVMCALVKLQSTAVLSWMFP
jgi:hypothetical protein